MKRPFQCEIVVSVLLCLVGCTSTTTKSASSRPSPALPRRLASLSEASDVDSASFRLAASSDSKKELGKILNRYVRVFYRAQGYLADFDKALDQAVAHPEMSAGKGLFDEDTATGAAHAKLLAARAVEEDIRHQISQTYLGAANAEIDAMMGTDGSSERIREFAAVFQRAIRKSGAQRIALQGIYEELGQASDQLDAFLVQSSSQSASLQIQGVSREALGLALNESNVTSYYEQNRDELAAKIKVAANDEEITRVIEHALPSAQPSSPPRPPPSSRPSRDWHRVYPDPGPAGMVTGREYPVGTWSLTFDDGPNPAFTPSILQNLQDHHLRATFFILTQHGFQHRQLVTAERTASMVQGDHTYDHKNLTTLGEDSLETEIVQSSRDLFQMIGEPRKRLFRCPYGAGETDGSRARQLAASQNMITVSWDVDSEDYHDPSPASIAQRVLKEMGQNEDAGHGGIILFHDGLHAPTIQASKVIMDEFVARMRSGRLRSVTVDEGIDIVNGMK